MIRNAILGFGALALALAPVAAHAASMRDIAYAPAPAWIMPPPSAPETPLPPGAPVRVIFVDTQIRITPRGEENYQAYRLKLLTPEALAAGNIVLSWTPPTEALTINRLLIIRDGRQIDVLKTQKFAVLQRENNLERAMLDGELTATLQTAGLQVRDEIEFAATRLRRDPNLGDAVQGFLQLPILGSRGAFRARLLYPKTAALTVRTTNDLPASIDSVAGDMEERRWQMVDPDSVVVPEGAPPRYAVRRLIQYSSYSSWADLSHRLAPLFATAATLAPGSAVKAEAARIAAANPAPAARALAALRLVEDQVRYVYVGLDGGNYRPATADQTWQRRWGDCKGKSVLLVALLRELGVAAEPVLANSQDGDGIDARLPAPGLFDHVLVRATIADKPYWLDATRLGDRDLAALDPPASRWMLPLRMDAAALEPVKAIPPALPQLVEAYDIDASAGFDKPAHVRVQQTLRGPEIVQLRGQLSGVAASDADRMLRTYWHNQAAWIEPTKTGWRFDDGANAMVLTLDGDGPLEWEGDAASGRTFYLPGGGFVPPDELKRPKDQDQAAAWATDYPRFRCWSTTLTLPVADTGYRWDYSSKPVARVLGGVAYWRIAALTGNRMRLTMSRRVLTPEISAGEAVALNAAIKGFDNNKSWVSETKGTTARLAGAAASFDTPAGFGSFAEFASMSPPCQDVDRAAK